MRRIVSIVFALALSLSFAAASAAPANACSTDQFANENGC